MDSILISAVIIPLISSSMVLGGLLSISILQLPTIRKNMRMQTEQEIYSRIMEARIRLENTENGKRKPHLCRTLYISQYP